MESKYWLFIWLLINSGETLLFFVAVYVTVIIAFEFRMFQAIPHSCLQLNVFLLE